MYAALQLLARQLGKPPFDLIDPGRRSRCKVHMLMRAAGEPGLDPGRLVGGIIVHHEVNVRSIGHLGVYTLARSCGLAGSLACGG